MSLDDRTLTCAALLMLVGATPAAAQSTDAADTGDRWLVRIAPYLWATSLDGNATVAGIKSDVDLSFSDILEDLSLAGMLLADLQKGRFGVAVNTVYARLTPENEVGPFEIKTTSDMLQLGVAPSFAWSTGRIARRGRASRCAWSSSRRRASASPICAPSSTCATAARRSTRARAGWSR